MVYKCCVVNCRSNYVGEEKTTVFSFPKDEDLRKRWVKFVNRKDWNPTTSSFICIKHFESKYYKKGDNGNRYRLVKSLKPVPTIFDPNINVPSSSSAAYHLSPVSVPRHSPRKRVYQEDQYQEFVKDDMIKEFGDINETLSPSGYLFNKSNDYVTFYKLAYNDMAVLEITECIKVDKELHVQLFLKSCPVPLPQWFRQSRDCRLSRRSMLENFPAYLQSYAEERISIFQELREYTHKKRPVYSANVIRYALLLRYTSVQSYRMLLDEFPFPSLSLLSKISSGKIDAVKCARTLKDMGKISHDVVLLFDEMYLQKSEEYFAGDLLGCDVDGDLYKGIVCFMIIGLKASIPYIIKSSPETKINADWLKDQLLDCLDILSECGFNVRAIICDNHPSNVSSFKKLLGHCNQDTDDLCMMCKSKKIYLCFDTVHLAKNIRNNLLGYKRFLFPSFTFDGFKDHINVPGGEIKWKTFHDVFEKDANLDANLRKAPKLSMKVLHPGNSKQSVPLALAIFDETTATAIQSYFPEKRSTVEFLKLFNTWWVISNSKAQFSSSNHLQNGVITGDEKPKFLRTMAKWVQHWQEQRIPNCEKFSLTSQTSSALIRTLYCHADLLEDLLREGYKYVLTSRLQSDPLERRFGQYRQMSGGRFLVGLREATSSEKIIKIKTLLKEGVSIDENVQEENTEQDTEFERLLDDENIVNCSPESLSLSNDSREVAVYIAGYIANKLSKQFGTCCNDLFIGKCSSENPDHSYVEMLSRGGLTIPSNELASYVCMAFATLDEVSDVIVKADVPVRKAANRVLCHHLKLFGPFTCVLHETPGQMIANNVVINIYFNNKRKICTDSAVVDSVKSFKRRQREKNA